jgi:hypothetical protein
MFLVLSRHLVPCSPRHSSPLWLTPPLTLPLGRTRTCLLWITWPWTTPTPWTVSITTSSDQPDWTWASTSNRSSISYITIATRVAMTTRLHTSPSLRATACIIPTTTHHHHGNQNHMTQQLIITHPFVMLDQFTLIYCLLLLKLSIIIINTKKDSYYNILHSK